MQPHRRPTAPDPLPHRPAIAVRSLERGTGPWRTVCASCLAALWLVACQPAPGGEPAAAVPTIETAAETSDATAWPRLPLDTPLPADRPLRAAFLVVDGVYNTELTAPYDILDHVRYQVQPGIEAFTVSPDGRPITTAEGLVIQPHYGFDDAPPADILVVASAEASRGADLENADMIDWVRRTGEGARFTVSLCWGAFVLGQAGLLDGRHATTFPRDFDPFAERFSTVTVARGPTFVHDGPVLTSQGGVRSFDVAMYLVDHLYGPDIARAVGGGLLIDWPYPGGSPTPLVVDASGR